MFEDFLTPDMLQIFFIAVAVVVILAQFFKDIFDYIFKMLNIQVPTKYVVFIFALIVVFVPMSLQGPLLPMAIFMGVLNSILLTLTAQKSYETILERAIKKIEAKSYELPVEIDKPPEDNKGSTQYI